MNSQLSDGQIRSVPIILSTWFRVSQVKYTPSDHTPIKIARVYLRVSTDEQDLSRQTEIERSARAARYCIAGVYREKASGARADRPELLRMIADMQPGEVVVAEQIDRISRLPLAEAEQFVASIRTRGAKLAAPGLVDLSDFAAETDGVAGIALEYSNRYRNCG
jgi:DNA invertase Pin-like site-specific DNA recombinase